MSESIAKKVSLSEFEFVDFGCSAGGSLEKFPRMFKTKKPGLGLDISKEKVEVTRAAGHRAEICDLTTFRHPEKVRFVGMSHLLEHIPDFNHVKHIIATACSLAKEFVYISQPFFDADGKLFENNLKLYCSHWSGHPNHMTVLEFHNVLQPMLEKGTLKRFLIVGKKPILDSENKAVHPLTSPINQHAYDAAKHDPKKIMKFDFLVFRETIALIDMEGKHMDFLKSRVRADHIFYDSANS